MRWMYHGKTTSEKCKTDRKCKWQSKDIRRRLTRLSASLELLDEEEERKEWERYKEEVENLDEYE